MILVVWTLGFGCVDVGILLQEHWILDVWTMDFGCVDAGSWLFGR